MYISNKKNQMIKQRKIELKNSISRFKSNGGGPVTFHFTKEILTDTGKIKKISSHKQVINMSKAMIKNRSVEQFIFCLQDLQHDLGANYFTL